MWEVNVYKRIFYTDCDKIFIIRILTSSMFTYKDVNNMEIYKELISHFLQCISTFHRGKYVCNLFDSRIENFINSINFPGRYKTK